jgi:hypothetical protein
MDPQVYSLLTTVLGASITGIFGIANTIIVLWIQRRDKVEKTPGNQKKSSRPPKLKSRQSMLVLIILICVGAGIGFYIGNATKRLPSIVRFYNSSEREYISREKVSGIELQIHEMEQVRARILGQTNLPEPEKEEKINDINYKIRQLKIEIQEYKAILKDKRN